MFSATELYELLKINVLLDHYQETVANDGPISFFDFLIMHYVTDDGNTKDNERDSQLPFKSRSSIIASNSTIVILERSAETVLTPIAADKRNFHTYTNPFIESNFCDRVWNPPRITDHLIG